jgi:uncharacterized OB-fold protein
MSSIAVPPQPAPDADTAPFWEATAEGRLSLCRCQSCSLWLQPPLERCRRCGGPTAFEEVAGTGTIYSYIVQRQASVVGYVDAVPYVVAIVELDEQLALRLPARIVDVEPEEMYVGLRVSCRLTALPGGPFVIPVFAPAVEEGHVVAST